MRGRSKNYTDTMSRPDSATSSSSSTSSNQATSSAQLRKVSGVRELLIGFSTVIAPCCLEVKFGLYVEFVFFNSNA